MSIPTRRRISGAEDFAFMLEKKPGAYIMIGNGGPDEGGCHNVHSPLYDFNDAHPDDGRGLLGQPGAGRVGQRVLVGSAGLWPAS